MSFSKNRLKGKSLIAFPENYCIIDIETTGLSPDFDSIIEISSIKIENGIEISQYSSLVKPDTQYDDGMYVDEFIESLTGITNEMLAAAPDILSVLHEFKDFIGDDILVGHNVNFDINFLYDYFENYMSIVLKNDYVDTMRLSRRLHPEHRHHRLRDLAERYDINYLQAHRALADCKITQQCYSLLKDDMLSQYGSLSDFLKQLQKTNSAVKADSIMAQTNDFDISHPLYEKVCVFTGTLIKMPRREAMQIVANLGGINGDSVTKKTNYLILGNNDYCPLIQDGKSTKQKKAEKLKLEGYDIEIIPENVFYDMI